MAPWELLAAATRSATHAGRHERERPPKDNAPHSSTQGTRLGERVRHARCRVALQGPADYTMLCGPAGARHTKSTDIPGRKNTKAKSTRTTHGAQTRHMHTSHHHAKACMLQRKESGIPNKAACRPYQKSTFCHGSSCEVARIQQKGPYTMELRCNSVCMLCRSACGQHRSMQQANTAAVKSRATDPV